LRDILRDLFVHDMEQFRRPKRGIFFSGPRRSEIIRAQHDSDLNLFGRRAFAETPRGVLTVDDSMIEGAEVADVE